MSTPWTKGLHVVRIGETGFAGGFDVYAVRDSNNRSVAECLTKDQAELLAAAPALTDALKDAITIMDGMLNDERPTTLYLGESLYKARAALAMAGAK